MKIKQRIPVVGFSPCQKTARKSCVEEKLLLPEDISLLTAPNQQEETPVRQPSPKKTFAKLIKKGIISLALAVATLTGLSPGLASASIPTSTICQEIEQSNKQEQSNYYVMTAEDYEVYLQKKYPSARISSSFYNKRPLSQYRKKAGFHQGYDFILPKNSVVPAGWSGKVTNIVKWSNGEYAVQVSDGNRMVQYGHVAPLLKVGDQVKIGTNVGKTKIDHVDIKIKFYDNYIDYGMQLV